MQAGSRRHRLGGLTIRRRLVGAFTVLVAMLVCMAGIGAWRLKELDRATTQLATVNLRVERLVGEWLSLTRSNAVRATALTHSDDAGLQKLLGPEMETTSKRINDLQHQIETLVANEQAKDLFDQVGKMRKTYLGIRQNVLEKKKAGQLAESQDMLEKSMIPALRSYVDSIQAMADHYMREVEADAVAAHASAISGRNLLGAFCAAGLAIAVMFSWLIMRSITRPIDQAVVVAQRVAAGDLSVQIQTGSGDEMGMLLKVLADMTDRLRELVSEVASGAEVVAESSAQIAQGNQDLSQRTEEQAGTLEETASSMEELTSTVAQNANNAKEASQLASKATEIAQKGGQVVGEVVERMSGISQSSRKISEIISVIDGIAFQTNILALNAAVEAARAGEQGRGFAVVASEVRTLAQRSAQAAKEIKGLIENSVSQVDAGSRLVNSAGDTMQEVVAAIREVSDLVADIAAASQEQTSGIEQVNTAVTQMDDVVQQNASLVEESAAATESLKVQAASLLELVARFKLLAGQAAERAVSAMPRGDVRPAKSPEPIRVLPRRGAAVQKGLELAPATGQLAQGWQQF